MFAFNYGFSHYMAVVMNKLMLPIEVFDISSIGIKVQEFSSKIAKYYHEYEDDHYLLRQRQIDIAFSEIGVKVENESSVVRAYYTGEINLKDFCVYLSSKYREIDKTLFSVNSTRRRLMATYSVDASLQVRRLYDIPFGQEDALTEKNGVDFRVYPRIFKELPASMESKEVLTMIRHFAKKVLIAENATSVKVIVHYTIVKVFSSNKSEGSTNSPEGIHQDGMDYIVSALVLERNNISGGISKIYSDKDNLIFTAQLEQGQGIFQPDRKTNLWHEVTPIVPIRKNSMGYRSSIGFDFEIER